MKILILSPFFPYPPNWGLVKRVYHLLEVLARTHRVTLVTYSEGAEAEHVATLRQICEAVHVVPVQPMPFGNKRLAQLASLASPVSFQRRMIYTDAMQQTIDSVSAGEPFDVIQIETSQMAAFRLDPRSVVVLDEHNIEYELYYRMFQTERSAARRAFNWLEYTKFKREEIASWRAADGCVMTSQREATLVSGIVPETPTTVVPNAVDTEFFKPSADAVDPNAIVLTGLMKYRPNVDGAQFFVNDVLPRILVKRPDAVFYIVGGDPPPEVTRLASRNVVVTGTVDDVRQYVHKAAIFAVPLRMGSGTRLKVLEGLSMGKPMVSTSLGCEGIDVVHNEHLLIADDAEGFANAVLELMTNQARARQLATAGRELMLRCYTWEVAAAVLEQLYATLGAGQRPAARLAV